MKNLGENKQKVFRKEYIKVMALILIGFLVNNYFLLDIKRVISNENIVKTYELVDVNKQWNRSTRYNIDIRVNNTLHKVSIDSETYNRIINEKIKPIIYYDKDSKKYYTEHSLNLHSNLNYFILFLFLFFNGYFLYYYLNKIK